MFNFIKIAIICAVFMSSAAYADADDWGFYRHHHPQQRYIQHPYYYRKAFPRPRYWRPPNNFYSYDWQRPEFEHRRRDWDDRR
jgi:hypothetical protein